MKQKRWIFLYIGMICAALVIGLCVKKSYTDYTVADEDLDQFQVAVWDETIPTGMDQQLLETLPDANYILRVRADGTRKTEPFVIKQHVTVEQVYRGNGIAVGEVRFFGANL